MNLKFRVFLNTLHDLQSPLWRFRSSGSLLFYRIAANYQKTLKSLIAMSVFLSEIEPNLSSRLVFQKLIFLNFFSPVWLSQNYFLSISVIKTPSFFLVKVLTSLMVIFVITKRIPLLAIQEPLIFVLNVYDFLSVEEFSRQFSRNRSFVKSAQTKYVYLLFC